MKKVAAGLLASAVLGSLAAMPVATAEPTTRAVALVAAVPPAQASPAAHRPKRPKKPKPLPRVDCRVRKCVALTFDDGPSPHTTRLLDMLRDRRARATFFVLGERVRRHPRIARRAFDEGHQMGTHTWDHPDLRRLSFGGVDWQIGQGQRELRAVIASRPTVFRPPYGATNHHVAASTRKRGLPQLMWSVDPRDWQHRNAWRVADHVVRHARRNGVVLLHDIHPSTVDAVPDIIRRLRGRGFVLVTVSEVFPGMRPGQIYPPHARTWSRPGVPG